MPGTVAVAGSTAENKTKYVPSQNLPSSKETY